MEMSLFAIVDVMAKEILFHPDSLNIFPILLSSFVLTNLVGVA